MKGTFKAMKDPGGYLKGEDINKIIYAARNEKEKLIIKTLAVTGRRISEVVGYLGVSPKDINMETSTIAFTVLKKKKDVSGDRPRRQKYVPRELCEELIDFSRRIGVEKDKPIFPMTRHMAFKVVRRAADRAGVTTVSGKRVHPHHFRHTFVTQRIMGGISWERALQIKEYMEHSNIGVTESYAHIDPQRQRSLFDC